MVTEICRATDPDTQDRAATLGAELTALVNRFITAVNGNIGDLEDIARKSKMVRDILALGLWETAQGSPEQGARLLVATQPVLSPVPA